MHRAEAGEETTYSVCYFRNKIISRRKTGNGDSHLMMVGFPWAVIWRINGIPIPHILIRRRMNRRFGKAANNRETTTVTTRQPTNWSEFTPQIHPSERTMTFELTVKRFDLSSQLSVPRWNYFLQRKNTWTTYRSHHKHLLYKTPLTSNLETSPGNALLRTGPNLYVWCDKSCKGCNNYRSPHFRYPPRRDKSKSKSQPTWRG